MRRILAILLLVAMASATIQLVTPKHIALETYEEVVIAPVGPGHDVFLKFARKPPEAEYVWDAVKVINTIDADWETTTYNDYEYIYYIIHVPTAKASGRYTFQFQITDNEGLRDPEVAVAQIGVTHDQNELIRVYQMPERFDGFAGEEILVPFQIENKALSRVQYLVTSSVAEMPSLGKETFPHSFLSSETKTVYIPVTLEEEGDYTLNAHVWSADNPTISQDVSTALVVKPTFASKLRSIGKGFPLVPLTMAPFYAVLGVFGW